MKVEYNFWNYELEYQKGEIPIFEVFPNKEIQNPLTLSKYYSLNNNSVVSFLNNEFYSAQPDNFNDLFDFNPYSLDFNSFEFSDVKTLIDTILSRDTEKEIEYKAFMEDRLEYLKQLRNTIYGMWMQEYGVLCTIENKYSDLMWAHYANNTGFLVEFDYKKFPNNFLGPYPINYITTPKIIDLKNIPPVLGIFIASTTKKIIWNYENEFRFLVIPNEKKYFKVTGGFSNLEYNWSQQERLVPYPKKSILKVILAFNFYKFNISKKITDRKSLLNFNDETGSLKSALFQKIIKEGICVEILVQDIEKFELASFPLDIKHVDGTVFEVEEIR